MRLLVLWLLAVPGAGLGPPLHQDGYTLRPPEGFRQVRMDLFHGTRAGAASASARSPRFLSAALVDGDGDDAASLAVSVVEEDFTLGPSARDEASTAVLRHFRDELSQKLSLERVEVVGEGARRVEVLGSVRQAGQLRQVLVAVFPGSPRHVVVLITAPSGRWEGLKTRLRDSLETLRMDKTLAGPPVGWRWAFAAFMGALLLVSVGLWRRRRAEAALGDR